MSKLLIFLFLSSRAFSQEISTSGDFLNYTKLHIQRVQKLGQELKGQFPKQFGDLDKALLDKFLALHDQSKLSSNTLDALYKFYGRSLGALTGAEKDKLIQIREKLNKKDLETRMEFLKQKGLVDGSGRVSMQGKKLLYLEKIVDLVDRGSSLESSKEFGRAVSAASKFLKSPMAKKMAQGLEAVYSDVTQGMSYKANFVRFGSTALKQIGKVALGVGSVTAAPLAIFGDLLDPSQSLAGDDEEFEIFYKKHPELTPHTNISNESSK